jgi:hypothetical protein
MSYPLTRPSFAVAANRTPRSLVHEQVADLIGRYPDLSSCELSCLVALFPRLRALDLSLMMADPDLSPRLEAFCATNRDLLGPSWADFAVIGAILSLPILILVTFVLGG